MEKQNKLTGLTKCKQIGGKHYQDFQIDGLDVFVLNKTPYQVAQIIKYLVRFENKNGLQDLQKAQSLLNYMVKNYNKLYEKKTLIVKLEDGRTDEND